MHTHIYVRPHATHTRAHKESFFFFSFFEFFFFSSKRVCDDEVTYFPWQMWKRMWGNTNDLCRVRPSGPFDCSDPKSTNAPALASTQPHITHSTFPLPLPPVIGTESGWGQKWDHCVPQLPRHTRCLFQCIFPPLFPPPVTLFAFVAPLLKCVSSSGKKAWKCHKVLLETRIGRPLSFPLSLCSEKGILEPHAWSCWLQNKTPVSNYRNFTLQKYFFDAVSWRFAQ